MCISMAAASLIVGGVSAATTFMGQQASASAQEAQNAQIAANADKARIAEQQALATRQVQESIASSRKKDQNNLKAGAARASALVSASEANLSGNSVFNLVRDVYRQQGENNDAIDLNNDMVVNQLQAEKESANITYQSRLNQRQSVDKANPFSLGLELGGAYIDYKKPPKD